MRKKYDKRYGYMRELRVSLSEYKQFLRAKRRVFLFSDGRRLGGTRKQGRQPLRSWKSTRYAQYNPNFSGSVRASFLCESHSSQHAMAYVHPSGAYFRRFNWIFNALRTHEISWNHSWLRAGDNWVGCTVWFGGPIIKQFELEDDQSSTIMSAILDIVFLELTVDYSCYQYGGFFNVIKGRKTRSCRLVEDIVVISSGTSYQAEDPYQGSISRFNTGYSQHVETTYELGLGDPNLVDKLIQVFVEM